MLKEYNQFVCTPEDKVYRGFYNNMNKHVWRFRIMEEDNPLLSYVLLSDALAPKKEGIYTLHINTCWCIHPVKGLIIYKKYSPQCNNNREIVNKLRNILYPWANVMLIPRVFVPYEPDR